MKKVVVLALLLFVCVGSLLAQENDKRKKKSITDSLFRIDQVDVMQKKKRIDLLGLDVPLRFVPITVSKLSSQMLDRKGIVDLMDAVKFLPGIVAKDKQYGQFQQFSIRGQGSAVVMIDGFAMSGR
ncbi:MAG: Plug domain-containing protein [Butyricimonas paravirosa]